MAELQKIAAAIIAELKRQAEITGCTASTNGDWMQVDGSFELLPLAEAVVRAAR